MSKKFITAAIAAVMLTGSVAATTTSAQAKPYWGGYHHGYGWGGPVALGLGALAIGGAIAASESYSDCYFVRRPVSDDWGNVYYRRVRVCN
jgi:hypothetical protein